MKIHLMKPTRLRPAIWAVSMAAMIGMAQEPQAPAGNWQSASHATYTNPALTGAELYLNVDVAKDGTFRGEWSQYLCNSYPGAYGTFIYSCQRVGSHPVSGRFGPDGQGTIDLEQLGRSAFTWTTPGPEALALELPKNWQGSDAILYRARLTRDGKDKPATAAGADTAREEGPVLSSVALYREFRQNEKAALERYRGRTLVLDGRRGTLIERSDGGGAIHIADGYTSRALVLTFDDFREISDLGEGAQFRFRCTVAHFDYQYVYMENCSIVR